MNLIESKKLYELDKPDTYSLSMSKPFCILIAPDSFKGSLSAENVANNLKIAIDKALPGICTYALPLADGGEGSIDAIARAGKLTKIFCGTLNPLLEPIETYYYLDSLGKNAYVELAKASGLNLLHSSQLNCLETSTYGTGLLIKDAIERNVEKIILFVGGSATNDAGIGLATALNIKFYDKNGNLLSGKGKELRYVHHIDDSMSVLKGKNIKIQIACDVNNPFYGKNGAAYVYAAQKGANNQQIRQLDEGLKNIASLISLKYKIEVQTIPGSGAAGGVGGGCIAFLDASLVSGTDIIFEKTAFNRLIKNVDLLITGEGKIDYQTSNEKLIYKQTKLAKLANVPIWAICGNFDGDENLQKRLGINRIFPLTNSSEQISDAIKNPKPYFHEIVQEIISALKSKIKIH